MKQLHERLSSSRPGEALAEQSGRVAPYPTLWQVNLLRVGYLVLGVGLAAVTWPQLLDHSSWTLDEGTVECILVAMSLLALVGIRYPVRMLPLLLFEVTWNSKTGSMRWG